MIRQPIITVLGHVDHGKTTLLDYIRGTTVAEREAGKITQHIGATEIPKKNIEEICGDKLKKLGIELTIPGLLFIDTPGHEAFTNLRKRGGSIADLAILVIDINQGLQPQTLEAIDILKTYKVPFIVAANKIDMLNGWVSHNGAFFLESFNKQEEKVKLELENKIYELVGKLYELGFNSERFDRVSDFTKQILIIPTSAKTGEGIPDLLLYASGLSQKFMEKKLDIDIEKPGRGSILEVKEVQGLGTTIDIILYEGKIRTGDTIVLAGMQGPIQTKVRALLRPKPLQEIRDPKQRFNSVKEVHAACGIKIAAPNLDNALPGGSVICVWGDPKEAIEEIKGEIEEIEFEKEINGVIVKADTLGSLEAMVKLLETEEIPVKSGSIGKVNKKDVMKAYSVKQKDNYLGVIFAFNTGVTEDALEEAERLDVPIFESNVIYTLLETYKGWKETEREKEKQGLLSSNMYPVKVKILPGYVFRKSKPAICGVEIISGILRPGARLINGSGEIVGKIKEIQDKGENVQEAKAGMQVAVSIDGGVIGRNINEGDVLYNFIPLDKINDLLTLFQRENMTEEEELLKEIKQIEKRIKE